MRALIPAPLECLTLHENVALHALLVQLQIYLSGLRSRPFHPALLYQICLSICSRLSAHLFQICLSMYSSLLYLSAHLVSLHALSLVRLVNAHLALALVAQWLNALSLSPARPALRHSANHALSQIFSVRRPTNQAILYVLC